MKPTSISRLFSNIKAVFDRNMKDSEGYEYGRGFKDCMDLFAIAFEKDHGVLLRQKDLLLEIEAYQGTINKMQRRIDELELMRAKWSRKEEVLYEKIKNLEATASKTSILKMKEELSRLRHENVKLVSQRDNLQPVNKP